METLNNLFKLVFPLLILVILTGVLYAQNKYVDVITIDGVINPTVSEYIIDSIKLAQEENAEFILLKMDTPGGLDKSMREIIKEIMASPIPVVVYVSPPGSRAASAGCFITMASHLAVMAPSTSIGAATPVSLGMGGGEMDPDVKRKITNDAISYMESLAKERGRNIKWARNAVEFGDSIDAEKAYQMGVVEVIACDTEDLLNKIDGMTVEVLGDEYTFDTENVVLRERDMGFRRNLLDILSDPNIAYILLILGFYGLFFELANPGSILPGIVGTIFLILAFYSLHTLPVNYAGIMLIIFALILFIVEVKVISHGVLTIGGIISLFLGSILLIKSPAPYLKISYYVIIPSVIATTAFFTFAVSLGIKAQLRKPTTGSEGLLYEIGKTITKVDSRGGKVFVHGEIWDAISDEKIAKDKAIKVIEKNGMVLKVEEPDN
jgi:membrane-bound serine protease (ClpP class)